MLNVEIPLAAYISIHAEVWGCETVGTVKQSQYISTHVRAEDGDCETVGTWCSVGGHGCYVFSLVTSVFTLVVKPGHNDSLTYKLNFTTIGIFKKKNNN